MNVLNAKSRILRTQIEYEKKKSEPNSHIIEILENELDKCIKELLDEC